MRTLGSYSCYRRYDLYLFCQGVFPRIRGIQSVDIGEKEQIVRVNHGRGDGRQSVVVAKFYFLDRIQPGCHGTLHQLALTLTETVSFSFTMGTTPIESSSLNVLTAFKYLVRYAKSAALLHAFQRRTHIGYVPAR
jgi:hypothetical protein